METRNISVTLKQAREWYNSGNDTLRTLALNAYTKEELELNYNLIESQVDRQVCVCSCVPRGEGRKFQVLAKLATIAKYYNKDWKKTTCNTGYYICNCSTENRPVDDCYEDVGVFKHILAQYAGIVYFRNYEDAVKALNILGDEVKELFK